MMVKAKGPVWHAKHKKLGIIPKGLRGVDKEATWAKSKAKGWVYGHGTFMLTSFRLPVVGMFKWIVNSENEAKRMETEIVKYERLIRKVFMDSKADDAKMYFRLKQDYQIQLITSPRKGMDKTPLRRKMISEMLTEQNRKDYVKRSTTVEPMQGLIADIFELKTGCWMRGNDNNKWLFAAMGVAVQMAQLDALIEKRSTWNIKQHVLGV